MSSAAPTAICIERRSDTANIAASCVCQRLPCHWKLPKHGKAIVLSTAALVHLLRFHWRSSPFVGACGWHRWMGVPSPTVRWHVRPAECSATAAEAAMTCPNGRSFEQNVNENAHTTRMCVRENSLISSQEHRVAWNTFYTTQAWGRSAHRASHKRTRVRVPSRDPNHRHLRAK